MYVYITGEISSVGLPNTIFLNFKYKYWNFRLLQNVPGVEKVMWSLLASNTTSYPFIINAEVTGHLYLVSFISMWNVQEIFRECRWYLWWGLQNNRCKNKLLFFEKAELSSWFLQVFAVLSFSAANEPASNTKDLHIKQRLCQQFGSKLLQIISICFLTPCKVFLEFS